ncbi:carbonate dehydratase [Clostridium tarantellae]|uniref:Carbonate dehydratase n=1 Tax=Clostridium tarantellae TaxID=39493 RepID=A0A6I1MJ76_9CLOT|nr:carbonate dehydratase [Clostridium tarantellae]MPQ43435.1 carbonate dehydratase [Clostridium tarantellae]
MNSNFKNFYKPQGPSNQYSYFISKNPSTSINPNDIEPSIHSSAFIGPFSCVIGDVTIDEHVFIACNAVIRADEGSPFYIGKHSNIQDGVILHALEHKYINVNSKNYAIYISDNVSCAHSSVIHGPCLIEDNVFIGVNAIIFNGIIKSNTFIGNGAIISDGVIIESGRFVPSGAVIDTQEKANALPLIPKNNEELAKAVLKVNEAFNTSYPLMFGDTRCSCGLSCNASTLINHYYDLR